MLVGASGAFADNTSTVQVANDSKSLSYKYTAGSKAETTKNISELFNKLSEITVRNRETVQELKVTSASVDGSAVDFVLTMVDGTENADGKEKSVVGTYDIEITGEDGAVISKIDAGTDDIETDNAGKYIKNISLGKLNTESSLEEKTYKLKISVADNVSERDINLAKENTEWVIKATAEQKAEPTPTPTAAATVAPSATPSATVVPEQEMKGIKYVGKDKDIMPGKYILTGNGTVKVYDSKDAAKTDIVLTDGKSEAPAGAVASYVLTLADGDKVEIYDHISLKPYDQKSSATAAPRGTAAPANAKNNKTNPKTGDAAPIAAVSALAITALGIFAYIEYSKRKKN